MGKSSPLVILFNQANLRNARDCELARSRPKVDISVDMFKTFKGHPNEIANRCEPGELLWTIVNGSTNILGGSQN